MEKITANQTGHAPRANFSEAGVKHIEHLWPQSAIFRSLLDVAGAS